MLNAYFQFPTHIETRQLIPIGYYMSVTLLLNCIAHSLPVWSKVLRK